MKEVILFNRKVFIKDIVIMTLIITLPFLFYLYRLVPEEKIWVTKYFTYDSLYFEDVNYFAWILLGKLMTASFIILWYSTCDHWWRNFILFPFIIESFRIFGLFNDEFDFIVNPTMLKTFLFSLPFSIIFSLLFFLLSKKGSYSTSLIDYEIYNQFNKIDKLKEKSRKELRMEFINLVGQKEKIPKEEYIKKIVDLRLKTLGVKK